MDLYSRGGLLPMVFTESSGCLAGMEDFRFWHRTRNGTAPVQFSRHGHDALHPDWAGSVFLDLIYSSEHAAY